MDKVTATDLPIVDDFNSVDSVVQYVHWQMDYDKKTTALKQLQGHIWLDGYQSGQILAQ